MKLIQRNNIVILLLKKEVNRLKHFAYVMVFILIFYLFFISSTKANDSSHHIIHSYQEDITGDGLHETIHLNGELLSEKSSYYRKIWISIQSPFSNEWKVPLKSGYEPEIKFIDLNGDQINDIFFINKRDENIYQYELYTVANGKIKNIPLPKQQYIYARYKQNFKIGLKLSPYHEEKEIDISLHKNDYIRGEIYENDGRLLDEVKPYITPLLSLEPVILNEEKGYGLKSVHELKRFDGGHTIGRIETLWYYKNNVWIILQSKWHNNE